MQRLNFKPFFTILNGVADLCERSRYAIFALLLVFFLTASAWIFNMNSHDMTRAHPDENHTLLKVRNLPSTFSQVGEMNRWFVRLLYPAGIYYMNSHMGGTILSQGWGYPGGYYLQEEFKKPAAVQHDPNIQDFVFFMRLAFGVLAVCSFCLVIWVLFSRFGWVAATMYGTLILSSPLVFKQFRFFYSETTMFIIFNIVAFLCLFPRTPTHRTAAYLGILSAAALSTKLTGAVLVVAPVLAYMFVNIGRAQGHKVDFRIELHLLFALAFLILINLPYGSYFEFVNATLSNVYHLKAGHSVVSGASTVDFFFRFLAALKYPVVLLFVASLLWLAHAPKRQLVPVYVLALGIAFFIWSLSNTPYYYSRNMASVYVAMSLVVALGVGDFLKSGISVHKNVSGVFSLGLMLVFAWGVGNVFLNRISPLSETFFERNAERIETCSSIGSIGLSNDDLQALGKDETITSYDQIRGPFIFHEDREEIFGKYTQFDCLVVRRQGQTKKVSNSFAPQPYNLVDRIGNLFFFVKNPESLVGLYWRLSKESEPVIRSHYSVYLHRNALVYVRNDCRFKRDTEPRFFLHVIPVDESNLSEGQRKHGAAGLDFDFRDAGGFLWNDQCFVVRELPDYAIQGLRTGQFRRVGGSYDNLWEARLDFTEHER